MFAWFLATLGVKDRALAVLERPVGRGFLVSPTLMRQGQFDFLRA